MALRAFWHSTVDICNEIGWPRFFCATLYVCLCVCMCVDVDECSDESGRCGPQSTCHNVPGSFRCSCPRGYEPNSNATSCQDMDECRDELMCQYGCINLPGGYRCECPIGFVRHLYWNQCIGRYSVVVVEIALIEFKPLST